MIDVNLKTWTLLRHLIAVGLILAVALFGADWVFSRMVLGQVDQALLALAQTEATAALADAKQPIRIHEMAPGTAPLIAQDLSGDQYCSLAFTCSR